MVTTRSNKVNHGPYDIINYLYYWRWNIRNLLYLNLSWQWHTLLFELILISFLILDHLYWMESQFDQFPKVHRTLCRGHDPSSFVLHLHVVLKSKKEDQFENDWLFFKNRTSRIEILDLDYKIGQLKRVHGLKSNEWHECKTSIWSNPKKTPSGGNQKPFGKRDDQRGKPTGNDLQGINSLHSR